MMDLSAKSEGKEPNPKAQLGADAMKGMSVETVVYCENKLKGQNFHGLMTEEHFTILPTMFTSTYGAPTQQQFTLVGLSGQNVAKALSDPAPPIPHQAEGAGVSDVFTALNNFRTYVDSFLSRRGTRIYPIALYKEL